ncbi:MAG: L-threonylcarbamoyladenylate synthase [Gammaproteobacteria bacterium]
MIPTFADDDAIERAAQLLRQGCLVAFPTETVYGLGADASNPEAVKRIFRAKGRPADHPLIVHIADVESIADWALTVPESARRLAARFWPGPLTLILKKKPNVPSVVTGGQDTVGLRVPDNPVALRLLRAFGGGVAAPSANRFKRISPTQASHVAEELGGLVDMILDGGPCRVGVESTIVDLSGSKPALLRPGQITRLQIEQVLGGELLVVRHTDQANAINIRAPGMMKIHYAPVTPALLCSNERLPETIRDMTSQGQKIGVLIYRSNIQAESNIRVSSMPEQADDYAQALYAALRELDAMRLDKILIEQPPETDEWRAINDRLSKAAAPCR